MKTKAEFLKLLPDSYEMSFPTWSSEAKIIAALHDQGIDAHLEACTLNTPPKVSDGRLHLDYTRNGLCCLLRRLYEHYIQHGNDDALSLHNSILETLGVDTDTDLTSIYND